MRCASVVIAHPRPGILHSLTNVLGRQYAFEVVATCRDGKECIDAIRRLVPDIALIAISLPDVSGLEILAIANSEGFPTQFVFFAASVENGEPVISAAAGAYPVLPKDAAIETLAQSLRQLMSRQSGSSALPSDQTGAIMVYENLLTDRQRQIMSLVSQGLSNKEIGRRLKLSDGTISVHLHRIYGRLEINNRTALAALALLSKRK
ncbi:response regulator transcription factor [Bradyrhizobium sp. 160]|uniref:response regulator transcription factor n=1 Tax=unclassified Bradyrhizobium TaxID=2631580 RepID=UPI001FF805E6|nr:MULTISPECIES: response regulator transcription factor [unclassified Bradyrhizobium]MCK1543963.1 response regulator transcription factor [Bradyrhizobium sp. 179]MCK1623277.1 response regulator transcription factor [Bradyrhizobium sp. 160]